jgi:hypothetical protein
MIALPASAAGLLACQRHPGDILTVAILPARARISHAGVVLQGDPSFACTPTCRCDNLTNCPGHLAGIRGISLREGASVPSIAGVAQSVEHLICNQRVGGSNPFASSRERALESEETNFPAGGGLGSGATGFSKRTPFGTFPACSGNSRRISASLGFPVLRK